MKLFAGLLVAVGVATGTAQAETVVSLTQVNYDAAGQVKCTATRMDPTQYTPATLEPDACIPDTEGTYGPDRITKNLYTVRGEIKEVRRAVGTGIEQPYARYTYSDNGIKTSEKDTNGNLTTLEYDGYDRVKKLRYPSTTIGAGTSSTTDYEQFTYDNNGNKLTWRRRNGTTITYCYDNLSRVTRENVSGVSCASAGQAADVFTGYDLRGNILWKRFASATGSGVSYGYDSLGRVNTTTDMNGRAIWFAYNAASARTATAYPDGFTFYRSLDALNRLNHVSNGSTVYFSQAYFSTGERKKLLRGAAIASSQRSDAACIAQTNATCYSYDALGRLTSMNIDLTLTGNDVTWTFTGRNPASQITSWNATSDVYDYEEITSSTVNPTYDGLNRDAGIAGVVGGGYDANGNLKREGITADKRCMVYDNMNRLLSVGACYDPVNPAPAPYLTLKYDPEGRLAAYTHTSPLGIVTTTEFLYDGVNLIGEYEYSGAYNGTGSSEAMTDRYVHGTGTDEPLIWYAGPAVSAPNYLLANYQGSIVGYSSSTGALTEVYKYGPYGEPINSAGGEFWGGSRFRYTGQYAIPEAELYYYKARVYDPIYGRFLQTDPIGSADDLNLYAYVGGDPVNAVDSTGMFEVRAASPEAARKLEGMINSRAEGTYKFNDQNVLSKTAESANPADYSESYSSNLDSMIASPNVATMDVAQTITAGGQTFDVDKDFGGGVTYGQQGSQDVNVVVSGAGFSGVSAAGGGNLQQTAADILFHETSTHAGPIMAGTPQTQTLQTENAIRQELSMPLRAPDPNHPQ